MNRYGCFLLGAFLTAAGASAHASEVRIRAEVVQDSGEASTPPSAQDRFPDDVRYAVEALYPARNNQARARIQIRYSCVDTQTGGLIIPCYVRIDPPVARADSGGHVGVLHTNGRPTGHHTPSEGYVDETTGYFNATYYASEIGGVVDSTVHCTAGWIQCLDGTVPFGVGLQTLEDLGEGVGYTLTGDRAPHPSNHWGVPAFLAGARNVARLFANDYPDEPLRYNDVSLQYGGVFDVETPTAVGYDWTPPHQTHRLGTNMDIGIPVGNARRALLLRLYQAEGIRVLQEDARHWHLIY